MKTGKIPGTVSIREACTMRSGAKIVIPINGMQSISSVEKLTGEGKSANGIRRIGCSYTNRSEVNRSIRRFEDRRKGDGLWMFPRKMLRRLCA